LFQYKFIELQHFSLIRSVSAAAAAYVGTTV